MTRDVLVVVQDLVKGLNGTHDDLDRLGAQLGLRIPPRDSGGGLSKAQRLAKAADALEQSDCRRLLQTFADDPRLRYGSSLVEVQDAFWSFEATAEVNQRVRRELARAVEGPLAPRKVAGPFLDLLEEYLWGEVSPNQWSWTEENPLVDVNRYFLEGGQWTLEQVFDEAGVLAWPSPRFAHFFQALISSRLTPDEPRLRELGGSSTEVLSAHGFDLVEVADGTGFPAFQIVPARTWRLPPQLILFASRRAKPDLRLKDVLEADIEVLSRSEDLLHYTDPVGPEGLTWSRLQAWWAAQHPDAEDPKRTLYSRLMLAVPTSSPQARRLFQQYYTAMAGRPDFPALLPEVWVHWDPQAKVQRGDETPVAHRIDFLMLQQRRRIVVEVDGMQHYATKDGRACSSRYTDTVRADRQLRLAGYEVYRFSTAELECDETAKKAIQPLVEALLMGTA